ncbi:hypothetical protein LC613_18425 [Nostoc sphaeroides CHAB 2801]|uniref:hypothetical protein n=1 Tax=Nostoc sphaeroides TaxID=446679 RepID=UPI0015F3102E|nr:hypothetical protein [Nostoc sphaeroides]MCC5629907.1 hypothetical protein [Nostoc sphaeroides CHAB 2801]
MVDREGLYYLTSPHQTYNLDLLGRISVPLLLVRGVPISGTAQSAMLVDLVNICACPYEPYDQPAVYYPSRPCWLFLILVYTLVKIKPIPDKSGCLVKF